MLYRNPWGPGDPLKHFSITIDDFRIPLRESHNRPGNKKKLMRASRLPFEYEVGGGAGDLVEGLPTDGTRGVHA